MQPILAPHVLAFIGSLTDLPIQPSSVRISELLDSRFGTVVSEFDTTVKRRQIACPLAENQLGRSARLRLSARTGQSPIQRL